MATIRPITVTDRKGQVTSIAYDERGQVSRITESHKGQVFQYHISYKAQFSKIENAACGDKTLGACNQSNGCGWFVAQPSNKPANSLKPKLYCQNSQKPVHFKHQNSFQPNKHLHEQLWN